MRTFIVSGNLELHPTTVTELLVNICGLNSFQPLVPYTYEFPMVVDYVYACGCMRHIY